MENFNSTTKKAINPLVLDSVEENTTFYYSNFKLFPDDSELLFASYLSFKKNLQASLGEDWESYAKKSVSKKIDTSTVYLQSRDIFSTALEVWLELRKQINSSTEDTGNLSEKSLMIPSSSNDIAEKSNISEFEEEKDLEKGEPQKESSQETQGPQAQQGPEEEKKCTDEEIMKNCEKDSTQGSESGNEDMRSFELFMQTVRGKFAENQINEAFFKAIMQAFYVSAIKVWKTTLMNYSMNPAFGGEEGSFLAESKRFFLNKLQNVYKTKFKMLKPILVATERVRDLIYRDTKPAQPVFDENDKKNMNNFTSNLQFENTAQLHIPMLIPPLKLDEEHDLKMNFNNLRINSTEGSLLGKRTSMQAHSVVEIKKMNKKFEKLLNQNTIEFAAHYVNNLTKNSVLDWQISRSFVTNMVEVNYNKLLQLENRLNTRADNAKNEIKIRFIQPAQNFYNRLMEIWIIFKAKSLSSEVLFTEYLDKVKTSLGNLWNEKFLTPTHNFFMTLYYEWHHLKQIENDTEEKVLLFTRKVKESMLKTWEDNIIKKAEELTSKATPNRQ